MAMPRVETSRPVDLVVYHGACLSPTACTGTHISGVAVDPRGNVWFSDSLSQGVGYLLPATGQVVARTIPASNAHPYDGLIVDKSQRVWFRDEFGLAITMWPAEGDEDMLRIDIGTEDEVHALASDADQIAALTDDFIEGLSEEYDEDYDEDEDEEDEEEEDEAEDEEEE